MPSKVILFGVLIFYSNFVVSVPYPEELVQQRVYWPTNWSGNEHAQRQLHNGFTHDENHVKRSLPQPEDNREYNDNHAIHRFNNGVNNHNPVALPVLDKQSLPHFRSPSFKREFDPNLHEATLDVPYPHNEDRSQIKTINQQLRNQRQHPSYTNKEKQPLYRTTTAINHHREPNANPGLEYHNEAKENVASKEHFVRQTPRFIPNGPTPYENLVRSNDNVPQERDDTKYTEQIASFPTYANKHQAAPEAAEALSYTTRERKHNTQSQSEANKLAKPEVLANDPGSRIYKDNNRVSNVGHKLVPTYNNAGEETAYVAADYNHENRRFITIDRLGSEYRIPVIPLNTYNNNAKVNYVGNLNQQDSFNHESSPNAALKNDVLVNHHENTLPVNTLEDKRYLKPNVRKYYNSPGESSSDLANKHHNILENNNNQVGSVFRKFIPERRHINEHHVSRNNLANNQNNEENSRNSTPDNIFSAAKEKRVFKEISPDNRRYTNNENPDNSYRELRTINAAVSPYVVEEPINRKYTETETTSFRDRDIKPENYNSLHVPENINANTQKNIGQITSSKVENRGYQPINTYDNAPAVVNHNEPNNPKSSRNIDSHRADFENYIPQDNVPAVIDNGKEMNKVYRPENYRHIENYNDENINHIPSNSYSPATEQIQNQVPNSRFTDVSPEPNNDSPSVLINDAAYNTEDRTNLDYRHPLPVSNHNNVPTELEFVKSNSEDIKYFGDGKGTVFGPFKTYNDVLQVISALETNEPEKQIFDDNYGQIYPNREVTFVPLPIFEISEKNVNRKYNPDISSNYKSEDRPPNVPSDTVNFYTGNPNQENQNRPRPGLLEPVSTDILSSDQSDPHQLPSKEQYLDRVSSNKNHFVLVQPDGTLKDVNNVDNPKSNKIVNEDNVNDNDRQDKVVEETLTTQSPAIVPDSITAATPVPKNTYISEINKYNNNEFANKDNYQESPVEGIYKTQTQTDNNVTPKLNAISSPVQENDNILLTNSNLPVNNNVHNLISPVLKDTELNYPSSILPVIVPESLLKNSNVNEADSNKEPLPTFNDVTTVVTTPYPYIVAQSPIESITDNIYDSLATTTVRPITESSTVLENYESGTLNEVQNDKTNNSSSVDHSKNYYTIPISEITSDSLRNNSNSQATEAILTNDNITRSDEKTITEQIINQKNENQSGNSSLAADLPTRSDDEVIRNINAISEVADRNQLESKQSPYDIKLVFDPNSDYEDDTITIAIDLLEALDIPGLSNGGVFNISPRNSADSYSNEVLNNKEDYLHVNGKPTLWVRAANDHNNRNYDSEIEPYPVFFRPVEPQLVMEKETRITQYPNGTIVTVITEVVYDNQGGTPPKVTKTETVENKGT